MRGIKQLSLVFLCVLAVAVLLWKIGDEVRAGDFTIGSAGEVVTFSDTVKSKIGPGQVVYADQFADLQTALDSVEAWDARVLRLPAGYYPVTATLHIKQDSLTFVGDGMDISIITCPANFADTVFVVGPTEQGGTYFTAITLRDFAVKGIQDQNANVGIYAANVPAALFENILVDNADTSFAIAYGWQTVLRNIMVPHFQDYGLLIRNQCGGVNVYNVDISNGPTGKGVVIDNSQAVSIYGGIFQGCGTGVATEGTSTITGLTLSSLYFEADSTNIHLGNPTHSVIGAMITGCFSNDTDRDYAVNLQKASNVLVAGNSFGGAPTAQVKLGPNTSRIFLGPNNLEATAVIDSGGATNIDLEGFMTYFNPSRDGEIEYHSENILPNGDFEIWASGLSAAPSAWDTAGCAIARDTDQKFGTYSAKMTAQEVNASLFNASLTIGTDVMDSTQYTASAWVKCDSTNSAYLQTYDGAGWLSSGYAGTDWTKLDRTFTTHSSGTAMVYITSLKDNAITYIDGVSLHAGHLKQTFTPYRVQGWASADSLYVPVGGTLHVIPFTY